MFTILTMFVMRVPGCMSRAIMVVMTGHMHGVPNAMWIEGKMDGNVDEVGYKQRQGEPGRTLVRWIRLFAEDSHNDGWKMHSSSLAVNRAGGPRTNWV